MIILGRMEYTGSRETGKVVQRDRNLFPETESFLEPHAILYCRRELKGDLERAKVFAKREGYKVYIDFPKGTRVYKAFEIVKSKVVSEED